MNMEPNVPILAARPWPSNAHLIEAVAGLGYLRKDWLTLDPTYGHGVFWKRWKPDMLTGTDLDPRLGHGAFGYLPINFTDLPFEDGVFDAVVFDPPYKLNGTPTEAVDKRYGVHVVSRWQDRMTLCIDGITECHRVLKVGGNLLVKCQDQVCSGHVRWQTDEFTQHALSLGMVKLDRFDMLGGREQPARTRKDGRPSRQHHARRNMSTLLVFKKT